MVDSRHQMFAVDRAAEMITTILNSQDFGKGLTRPAATNRNTLQVRLRGQTAFGSRPQSLLEATQGRERAPGSSVLLGAEASSTLPTPLKISFAQTGLTHCADGVAGRQPSRHCDRPYPAQCREFFAGGQAAYE